MEIQYSRKLHSLAWGGLGGTGEVGRRPHSSRWLWLNLAGDPVPSWNCPTRTPNSSHFWPLVRIFSLPRKSVFSPPHPHILQVENITSQLKQTFQRGTPFKFVLLFLFFSGLRELCNDIFISVYVYYGLPTSVALIFMWDRDPFWTVPCYNLLRCRHHLHCVCY